MIFPAFSFLIEVLAATKLNRVFIYFLIVINLFANSIYPIAISFKVQSHPLLATYLMMFSTGLLLKLISFHHVYHDNRNLVRRLAKLKYEGKESPVVNLFNLPKDVYEEAIKYPNNLRFKHFMRFMFAPTCCYQLIYPSSDRIRPWFLLKRFVEIVLVNAFIVYIFYQHMLPICEDSVQFFEKKDYF